jgi:hypothetical protein
MLRVCQAPGCTKLAASRYARYCSAHKIRNRRHGDVSQEAVSAADLAPFVRQVEARVAKNADSPVWATLEQRWGLLVQHAQRIAAQTGPIALGCPFPAHGAPPRTAAGNCPAPPPRVPRTETPVLTPPHAIPHATPRARHALAAPGEKYSDYTFSARSANRCAPEASLKCPARQTRWIALSHPRGSAQNGSGGLLGPGLPTNRNAFS